MQIVMDELHVLHFLLFLVPLEWAYSCLRTVSCMTCTSYILYPHSLITCSSPHPKFPNPLFFTRTHTHTHTSQNHAPGTPPASMATGMATSNHSVGYRTLGGQQQQFSSLSGHPAGTGAGAPQQQPGGNSSMTPSTPVHHQPPTPSVS